MSRHALITNRRAGSPGSVSFLSLTSWARPTTNPGSGVHYKPFTTKAGLDAAIAAAVDGDYIVYTGTGVLSVTSSSTPPWTLTKSAATGITIDLGTATNYWGQATGGNYVEFNYTGTANQTAAYLHDCTNINIYGGSFTCPGGGAGIKIYGNTDNLLWYDAYVHHAGSSGIQMAAITGAGAATNLTNTKLRVEVNRWSMNPIIDSHADLGSGNHGIIAHGNTGNLSNTSPGEGTSATHGHIAVYAHDPLQPGEASNGHTWPEGGGGSALEFGQDSGSQNNLVGYALLVNGLMKPDGSNNIAIHGSKSTVGTGTNVVNLWGPTKLNGLELGWAEGDNITGSVVHGDGSSWWNGVTSPIVVDHGRGSNVNQYTGGGNASYKYIPGKGIVYNDST